MLLNLIENGIKYGKSGGKVEVSAIKTANGCEITVEDDGIGIDGNDISHIFDRFYRVDKSRDRSGTGLGLSIVKWIVDEHKGQISVESEIYKGTNFKIEI
jgi:two-component system phosphate regulon sensor histidine kinase PhoR